ncbi:MAG: hypothetical protein IJR59_07225 [Firmicutes bacterium]|nr:hypothetical protein [Bacillota bacterium]
MANIDVNEIKNAVIKLSQDDGSKAAFAQDPVKAVESLLGVDLPDDLVNGIIDAVKKNLSGKDLDDMLKMLMSDGNLLDKIKGLFAK